MSDTYDMYERVVKKIKEVDGEFSAGDPTRHHLLIKQHKLLSDIVTLHQPMIRYIGDEFSYNSCAVCEKEYPCLTINLIRNRLSV